MTLLRYVGPRPEVVEGHRWCPGESRWVTAEEAARLVEVRLGDVAAFERVDGEQPHVPMRDRPPVDRMLRPPPWGAPWRS